MEMTCLWDGRKPRGGLIMNKNCTAMASREEFPSKGLLVIYTLKYNAEEAVQDMNGWMDWWIYFITETFKKYDLLKLDCALMHRYLLTLGKERNGGSIIQVISSSIYKYKYSDREKFGLGFRFYGYNIGLKSELSTHTTLQKGTQGNRSTSLARKCTFVLI